MKEFFLGSAVALVTPMKEDGAVDYEQFAELVEKTISGGVQAILVNGTTGEASTLTTEEEHELIRVAIKVNQGRVPVIAGTGSNDTRHALQESMVAKELGVDALLLVTPYYNKSSQRGLIEHFTTIANAVQMPVILYNIPGRTGVNINVDTAVELAKNPYIVAMKEASANMAYTMEVLAKTKDMDFTLYSGEDALILPFIAAGGKGVISVLSNVYPRECQMLCEYALNGELDKAQALCFDLHEVCRTLFIDINPIPVKAALNKQGICGEYYRLPLIPTTDSNRQALYQAMDEFEKKGY